MIFLHGAVWLCALLFVSCANSASNEIESNFINLLTAVRENDRDTLLVYAPFMAGLSPDEQNSLIDLFKQIADAPKAMQTVPGGTRTKNLTVELPEKGLVFTFAFEKQGGVWALTQNIRVKQAR
jgi:hypothetical protein